MVHIAKKDGPMFRELESHGTGRYICNITVSATIMKETITFGDISVKIIILQEETGKQVSPAVVSDITQLKMMVIKR